MHRVFSLKIEVCYLDNAAFLGCFLYRHEAAIAIARKQIQIAPAHFSKAIAPSQHSPRFKWNIQCKQEKDFLFPRRKAESPWKELWWCTANFGIGLLVNPCDLGAAAASLVLLPLSYDYAEEVETKPNVVVDSEKDSIFVNVR